MKREPLTDRQAEVLAYIKTYIQKFGVAPSLRGVSERFDIQVAAAASHVRLIEQKGYIKRHRENGRAVHRAMVVVD